MGKNPAHATCSYIDLSGYASGTIRSYLFKDYIITINIDSFNA